MELPLDEAESTIQNYLEHCNQEGSSHHHHNRRPSSLSESAFLPEEEEETGDERKSSNDRVLAPLSLTVQQTSGVVNVAKNGACLPPTNPVDAHFHPPVSTSTESQPMNNASKTLSTPAIGKKHNYMRPFKCSECGKRSNW